MPIVYNPRDNDCTIIGHKIIGLFLIGDSNVQWCVCVCVSGTWASSSSQEDYYDDEGQLFRR